MILSAERMCGSSKASRRIIKKEKKNDQGAVMNQGVIKFDWGFDSVDSIHVLCGDAAGARRKHTKEVGPAASCVLWKAVRVTDVGFCAYFVCPSFSTRAF